MPLRLLARCFTPCDGTPIHELACGHIVQASLLTPASSSACAPNCRAVNLNTSAEPKFLCPPCYKAYFKREYDALTCELVREGWQNGGNLEHAIAKLREQYKTGDKSKLKYEDMREIDWLHYAVMDWARWDDVWKSSYRTKVLAEGRRACKAVDKDEV